MYDCDIVNNIIIEFKSFKTDIMHDTIYSIHYSRNDSSKHDHGVVIIVASHQHECPFNLKIVQIYC